MVSVHVFLTVRKRLSLKLPGWIEISSTQTFFTVVVMKSTTVRQTDVFLMYKTVLVYNTAVVRVRAINFGNTSSLIQNQL